MTLRVRFWLVAALVAMLALGSGVGAQAGQLVLKPRWRLKLAWLGTVNGPNFNGPNSSPVVANSRYVAFVTYRGFGASWPTRPKTVLIDKRTGKQRVLTRSPCAGSITIGGPWLMCTVSPVSAWLYNLRRGGWTNVHTPCLGELCDQAAVGTYWIKTFGVSHGLPGVPIRPSVGLVNIRTGSVIGDPAIPGGSTSDDLNSASGQQGLCPPLRYPPDVVVGSVTFYGRFALIANGGIPQLQACKSQLNLRLGAPWAASTNAVVWSTPPVQAGRYLMQGVFLPSLRHFTIRLPRDLAGGISAIAVSGRSLYVDSNTGHLWTAQLPTRG